MSNAFTTGIVETHLWDKLVDRRVRVYWNLHRQCFSVLLGGLVVAHMDNLDLKYVTFVVRPAGNKRVRETRRKNVHAFVCGTVTGWNSGLQQGREATYNPYKHTHFVYKDTGETLAYANTVQLSSLLVESGDWRPRVTITEK